MTRADEMNLYVEELRNLRENVPEKMRCAIYCLHNHNRHLSLKTLEHNKLCAERIIALTSRDDRINPLTPCEVVAREMAAKIVRMN